MIHRVTGTKPPPYTATPLPAEPLELDACYRYCETMARARTPPPTARWAAPPT